MEIFSENIHSHCYLFAIFVSLPENIHFHSVIYLQSLFLYQQTSGDTHVQRDDLSRTLMVRGTFVQILWCLSCCTFL